MLGNYKSSVSLCLLLLAGGSAYAASPNTARPVDWSRLVVVGDSLSAGVQNFSLLDVQQPNGYASLLAKQVGTDLTLPLVSFPGLPNVLELVNPGPPPVIEPDPSTTIPMRENPTVQNTDVSVPGITLNQALTVRPVAQIGPTTPSVQIFATYVLGFPSLLSGNAPTEIELATQLKPTTVIEWLGNNDALVPALIGQLNTLTPVDSFARDYETVLDRLTATGARIITANIPDVTEVAYFMPVSEIAQEYGLSVPAVMERLGIGPQDSVRITGAGFVDQILTGQMAGPLPATCPSPEAGLSTSGIPCVLTAAQALQVRSAVSCYNLIIAAESLAHGAVVVDIKGLVDSLYQKGYKIGGNTLNLDFLGGIATLDGIHPTDTAYGIIANKFIDTINGRWGTHIPDVNLNPIAAQDPLIFPSIISHENPQHPLPIPGFCLLDLFSGQTK